jgi:PII-like signaling protein
MERVAIALVEGGWPVFPCGLDKAPLVSGGFKSRTTDAQQVRQWWATHPEALPAIVPGDQGYAAIDVDSTGAADALKPFGLYGFASGFIVETGGTSKPFESSETGSLWPAMHIYVKASEQPKIPGAVVRFRGGYVIAPGAKRGGRLYRVCAPNDPKVWVGEVRASGPVALRQGQRAEPLPERVAEAVACIPNTEHTDRDQYVAIAHMIKGALGEDGLDLFLSWASRFPGAIDRHEDERVFETITKPRTGWAELWHYAALHGFDASPEVAAEALADFAEPGPSVVEVVDTRTKLNRMLIAVRDAPDGIDRALSLMRLRRAGFSGSEIRSMLSELVPVAGLISDEGIPLGELLRSPELMKSPDPLIPFLAWPGIKTILSAREKAGKSTLAMAGAAAATRGDLFLGERCPRSTVLWLSEEPPWIVGKRAQMMGADMDRFVVVLMGQNPQSQIMRAVSRWAPQVVVIDTLFRFAGVEGDGENDSGAWIPVMLLFDKITKLGAALLVLVHSLKNSETGEYRGSSAIGGFVDAILEMHKPKEGQQLRRISGKGRLHFGKPFAVRLAPDEITFDLLADAEGAVSATIAAALVDYFEMHPGASGNMACAAVKGKKETKLETIRLLASTADGAIPTLIADGKGWRLATAVDDLGPL